MKEISYVKAYHKKGKRFFTWSSVINLSIFKEIYQSNAYKNIVFSFEGETRKRKLTEKHVEKMMLWKEERWSDLKEFNHLK